MQGLPKLSETVKHSALLITEDKVIYFSCNEIKVLRFVGQAMHLEKTKSRVEIFRLTDDWNRLF